MQNEIMKKIGLTGGIGVGKTFVAELFQQLGVPVFNADIEAKKCMVEDEKLVSAVQLAFGESIYMNAVCFVLVHYLDLRRVYVTPFLDWAGRLTLGQASKQEEARLSQGYP